MRRGEEKGREGRRGEVRGGEEGKERRISLHLQILSSISSQALLSFGSTHPLLWLSHFTNHCITIQVYRPDLFKHQAK